MELLNIYGPNMVFERDASFFILGKNADVIKEAYLIFESEKITAKEIKIQKDGSFSVEFPPINGSFKGYTLVIDDFKMSPIYFGDVILTLGQSNMSYGLSAVESHDKYLELLSKTNVYCLDILESDNSVVDPCFAKRPAQPLEDINKRFSWKKITKENALSISALSVMSSVLLSQEVNFPIGFIHTSMGGLAIESYLIKEVVDKDPLLVKMLKRNGTYIESAEGYNKFEGRNYTQLSGVFNEKVAPLKPFKFLCAIYYLGESGCYDENTADYTNRALTNLISSYRNYFGFELPFIVTEIADCFYPYVDNRGYNLVNEALENIKLDKTYFVPIHDIESRWIDENDQDIYYHPIHPRNKEEIAKRYVKTILNNIYKDNKSLFPRISSYKVIGKEIVVEIDSTFGILDSNFYGFTIAGIDNVYYPAIATLQDKNTIKLSSPFVEEPVHFTYAFDQYNYYANVRNTDGYPLLQYRSHKDKIKDSLYLFDELVLSCDYLEVKKEDNFGYEVAGGFPNKIIEEGNIVRGGCNVSLDEKNKTFGSRSVKCSYVPTKKENYYYFSTRFNLGYCGLDHRLAKFKYLTLDLKSDINVEFHGVLFRLNGKIMRFPVIDKNGEMPPFANITNEFKKFAVDLTKMNDGSQVLYDASIEQRNSIIGVEIYFRSTKKCEVNIDNIVLTNCLKLVDDLTKIEVVENDNAALVIPKNSK